MNLLLVAFATMLLGKIAAAVGLADYSPAVCPIVEDSVGTYRGRVLTMEVDEFGEVSHIGYRLFPNDSCAAIRSEPVLRFLERYALELDLCLDGRSAYERIDWDKVVLVEGDIRMLRDVTPSCGVSIEEIERRMYRVTIDVSGEALVLTIPSDGQLLLGANDVELEDIFERRVRVITPPASYDLEGHLERAEVYSSDSIVIAKIGEYISTEIRNELRLTKDSVGNVSLMDDISRPRESMENILLTGQWKEDIPLHLILDRYGYKRAESDITLQQLIALCLWEGCRLYVGIKTVEEDVITATLFALNTKLAYNHVISITFPKAVLASDMTTPVKARVYTYIPLQNVNEKFFNLQKQ